MRTPYIEYHDFTLWLGDVREVLPELPSESVDCALTSPPFYALRDYGVDGQIGLEATPDEWVAELVGVFREVRRVLRPAGTLWVECGDSYAANRTYQVADTIGAKAGPAKLDSGAKVPDGMKQKDLIGAPWLLAFALRADGWYLRQCIVWHKQNAMPESVRDRCTTAHSYVFLFSKKPRYFFDADAIAEPYQGYDGRKVTAITNNAHRTHENYSNREGNDRWPNGPDGSRNVRSVWSIPTQGFSEAHFATWPEALVERILKAGCPEWVCGMCGKPRERLTEVTYGKSPVHGAGSTVRKRNEDTDVNGWAGETMPRLAKNTETVGWSDCGHGNYRPGVCLDPFMGSGTTALVARRLGRKAVGVELNPEYAEMAARRNAQQTVFAPQT